MVAHSLTLTLALVAQAAAPHRVESRVVQATAARAYLDAGSDEGLADGVEVVFHRAGAEVARCRLEVVAARAASCSVHGVRAGDSVPLPGLAAQGEEPKLLPPPAAPELVAAQAKALAAAPLATVEYAAKARPEARRAPMGSVELSEVAWVATSATPFAGTRAAVSIREADVGLGLRLDVDAQAIRWTSRPSNPDPRYRPKDASQLFVWQAGLSRDPGGAGAAVSVGRLMAWRIPGATILDGAIAGWRLPGLEVGAFGGLVPDPMTLALTADRSTGGGYWAFDHAFSREASFRDEGRVAVVVSPELGTRFEGETRAAARFGRGLDLSGSVRLGFGGDAQAAGNVDAARLELAGRPAPQLRLAAWLAYDGLEVPGDAEPMVYAGRSRRAEASASWEVGRNVRATLLGGVASDLASGLDREWVGPVIDLPRLLFGRGGLSLGYLEELGWTDGRSAWLQLVFRPLDRLRLLARFSWAHATALAVMQDELAATLGLAADISRVFSARLTVTGRGALAGGEGGGSAGGGTVFATLAARY